MKGKTIQQIEYKKHKLYFREDTDAWHCDEPELRDPSLKALKGKLDAVSRGERRVDVEAYLLEDNSWGKPTATKVLITSLCEPDTSRYRQPDGEIRECWITQGKSRSKVQLRQLALIEHQAKINDWLDAASRAKQAEKIADKLHKDIPRIDPKKLLAAKKESV